MKTIFKLLCILLLILFNGLWLLSSAQTNDPAGANNFFSHASELNTDTFLFDRMVSGDVDLVKVNLEECTGYRLLWGFPDTNSLEFVLLISIYHSNDTLTPVYSKKINKGNQNNFFLNASGTYFLKQTSLLTGTLGDYGISLFRDSADVYECNNSPAEAKTIESPSDLSLKLHGMSIDGKPDEDWFKVQTDRCGVFSARVFGAGISQRITISVFNLQMELIGRSTAMSDGENVSLSVLVEDAEYYIQIAEFDSCCGSGNDTIYNLVNQIFLLSLSFDSSDATECNNTFEDAYSLELNTPYQASLNGINLLQTEQAQDLDYFMLSPPGCGVLNLSFTNVPANQALEINVYNSRREQINFAIAGCHGCDVFMSTLTDGKPVYVKITEYDGCCSGNNATYNLSEEPYTINSSFDSSDVYECNDIFNYAPLVSENDTLFFKILGKNNTNRLGASDRDIFKLSAEVCSEIKIVVDQIPAGFDLKARIYSDTLNLSSPLMDVVAKGPDSLTLIVNIPSGKSYYIVLNEDGDNSFSSQLMRARFSWTNKGPMAPVIFASGDTEICPGDSLTLTSSIAFGNRWNTGDTTQTIVVRSAGIYRDTITDGGSCYAVSTPISVELLNAPDAVFSFLENGLEVTFVNESSSATSYLWSFGDGETSAEQNPVHIYPAAGVYKVTLIASNKCFSDTLERFVTSPTGDGSPLGQSITVYPQPSNGSVRIKGIEDSTEDLSFFVYDASGRLAASGNLLKQSEYSIELNLPTGMYMMLAGNQIVHYSFRLIIINP
jgi:hypothetical protein